MLEKRTSRAVKIQTKRQELGCTSSLLIHLLEQSVCNSSAAIITISKIHLFSTCFCARRVSMNPVGKENCRLFLAQRNWKCVFTRAACKEILELFFKSVKRMLRFITIHCYENGWGEHFVALLLNFVRSSKFSAHKFNFFLCGLNQGKGIDQ